MDVDESQDLVEDPSDVPVTPTEPTEPTEPTKPTGPEDSMREPMADPTEDPQDEMEVDINNQEEPFYVRYYTGHKGKFGHEFLEFDITALSDGRVGIVRYANNSNYRNDSLIKKEMAVSSLLLKELKRIIAESEILKEDDSKWPERNREGKQELEIRLGRYHISFETAKIGSLNDVQNSEDPEGLRVFYYLVQDLKNKTNMNGGNG